MPLPIGALSGINKQCMLGFEKLEKIRLCLDREKNECARKINLFEIIICVISAKSVYLLHET